MSALERATQILEKSRSFSGDAILAANYTDDSISRGFGYQCRRVTTISNVGTYKFVFDLSAVSYNKGVFVLPLHLAATGGPALVKVYSITSYSGGTVYPSCYLNNVHRIAPQAVIKHGITSSDTAGDDLKEYIIGSDGTPATARSGGAAGAVPTVFPPGPVICMEVDNNYSGDIQFAADIVWFEVIFG